MLQQSSLTTIAQHMFSLMLRNMSSDGFMFADPLASNPVARRTFSAPDRIITAPSFPADHGTGGQDHAFDLDPRRRGQRDGGCRGQRADPAGGVQPLIDYLNFAWTCQNASGSVTIGHAPYTIEGRPVARVGDQGSAGEVQRAPCNPNQDTKDSGGCRDASRQPPLLTV